METAPQNGSSSAGGGGGGRSATPDPPVLSLEQIRTTGSSNEYTEGPTVTPRLLVTTMPAPARQRGVDPGSGGGERAESQGPRLGQRSPANQNRRDAAPPRDTPPRSPADEDSGGGGGGVRTSRGPAAAGERIVSRQPKRAELKEDELKPLTGAGTTVDAGNGRLPDKHGRCCADCGRCVCAECSGPRPLPSCWLCGRRCACSAQSAAEYASCVCCVKGLFYHCSSDDEDTCADKPFSCSPSHRCARWSAIGLLSALLPCLLCYLPARGCLALCQGCYDLAERPGCRCKDAGCKCLGRGGTHVRTGGTGRGRGGHT